MYVFLIYYNKLQKFKTYQILDLSLVCMCTVAITGIYIYIYKSVSHFLHISVNYCSYLWGLLNFAFNFRNDFKESTWEKQRILVMANYHTHLVFNLDIGRSVPSLFGLTG